MAAAGISTLGITFGYGTETTAGTKPTSFKQLTRINAIGGISIEPEHQRLLLNGLHLSQPIKLLLVEIECGLKPLFPEKINLSSLLHSRPSRFHNPKSDRTNF